MRSRRRGSDREDGTPRSPVLAALSEAELDQLCLDRALRFLANRPRSEREIRRRMTEKGFEPDRIDRVIAKLTHLKLVDDRAFADYWLENRTLHRPKGTRALKAELFQKGVDREVVEEALEVERDEGEEAYRAAEKRALRIPIHDQRVFRTTLAQHLQRRGFDWDAIGPVVDRLWRERSGGVEPEL